MNFSVILSGSPEINLKGNNVNIVDGDIIPSPTDHTDFQGVHVSSGTVVRTFTIENTGSSNLTIPSGGITLTGTNAADFTIGGITLPATISGPSGSTTFTVTFDPSAIGLRTATVNIANDDSNENPYDFAIQGNGWNGDALDFDGTNDNVIVADNATFSTNLFTAEAWIYPTSIATYRCIFGRRTSNNGWNLFVTDAGNLVLWNGWTLVISGPTVPLNQWMHVAVVSDATGQKLYSNGTLVGQTSSVIVPSTGQNFVIGSVSESNFWYFSGKLDEVRYWDHVRNCDQINQLKNCELTGAETGLKAYYQFNQGLAGGSNAGLNSLYDITSNNHVGTLNGFALSGSTSNWVQPGGVTTGNACSAVTNPEINLRGNGISIIDGDITPSTADSTNLGSQIICSGSITRFFTIENTGSEVLNLTSISVSGGNSGDFTIAGLLLPTTLATSSSKTFTVSFDPSATGMRSTTINIASDDCDENPYNYSIQGTGNADGQLPAITCPSNIVKSNDGALCSAVATYTSPVGTDNCPSPTTTRTTGLDSGSAFPVGVTTNTFRVTDATGNTATCSFTVTVNDSQLPQITCPGNQSANNTQGTCGKVMTYSAPVGTDNCAGQTTLQTAGLASGSTFPVGITTNIFKVTDASSNTATCSFTITINDTEIPIITRTGAATINLCKNDSYSDAGAMANDNCGGNITSNIITVKPVNTAIPATYIVTYNVSDASSNAATQVTRSVIVNALPGTTCPTSFNTCKTGGNITLSGATPSGGIYSGTGVTGSVFDPLVAGAGMHTITYSYTDGNGCIGTCTFVITVFNPPIFNVSDGMYYCTLAEAIDAANTGDGEEISIPAGTYMDACLMVNKSLKFTAIGGAVIMNCIEMNGSGKALTLGSDFTFNTLKLTLGNVQTNGFNLKCGTITGKSAVSYVITD